MKALVTKKSRIIVSILFAVLVTVALPVTAHGQFAITYYDNYNYDDDKWDDWSAEPAGWHGAWDDKYLVNFDSEKTEKTVHYRESIDVFDLRGDLWSLDDPPHGTGGEDWNPLKSIEDTVPNQSPHHLFGAIFTGWVYFEGGEKLLLASDDDAYVFLDDNTAWGQEVLSVPYISFFDSDILDPVPAELEGYHKITVKFAERQIVHSGIEINLNDEPLEAVLAATIEIKPETLNLKSKGVFTAFIDLPEGYDEQDIAISTVECEGAPALKGMMANDGRLIVKFDRKDLEGVSPGDPVELVVTGQLTDGRRFRGSDTIRVIEKGK